MAKYEEHPTYKALVTHLKQSIWTPERRALWRAARLAAMTPEQRAAYDERKAREAQMPPQIHKPTF